jgi:nucleotide-binding universal stress UspA family protein
MVTKIMVPTDGSKPSKKAVEYAASLAKKVGAKITLLNVIDKSSFVRQSIPAFATPTKVMEPVENYLKLAAETYLDDAAKVCTKKEVNSTQVIRSGHPVDEIIREAKKSKVDLIVMGSRGQSALKAAVIGSVTFGVINKETKIPVLVVRQ